MAFLGTEGAAQLLAFMEMCVLLTLMSGFICMLTRAVERKLSWCRLLRPSTWLRRAGSS